MTDKTLTPQEAEIVDGFERLERWTRDLRVDDPREDIRRLVREARHGPDALTPAFIHVDFARLLEKGECPTCAVPLRIAENPQTAVACPQCMMAIPPLLYERARERRREARKLAQADVEISKKIAELKLSQERISQLFELALLRLGEQP